MQKKFYEVLVVDVVDVDVLVELVLDVVDVDVLVELVLDVVDVDELVEVVLVEELYIQSLFSF